MERLLIVWSVAVGLVLLAVFGCLRYGSHIARRQSENDVARTVETIHRLGKLKADRLPAIMSAGVGMAGVQIVGTNPVAFTVRSATPWPDVMIYEYDSKTPERGVCHYSF